MFMDYYFVSCVAKSHQKSGPPYLPILRTNTANVSNSNTLRRPDIVFYTGGLFLCVFVKFGGGGVHIRTFLPSNLATFSRNLTAVNNAHVNSAVTRLGIIQIQLYVGSTTWQVVIHASVTRRRSPTSTYNFITKGKVG